MNQNDKAKTILMSVKYATLATVTADGAPWNSPVFCAYDESLNVYWSSTPDAVHSVNIMRNEKVFIVVYNSASDEGEGVYLECSAEVLKGKAEIRRALELLGERRGESFRHIEKFMAPGPQRIFKATPQKIWMNDADKDTDGDFIRDYRVPVNPIAK